MVEIYPLHSDSVTHHPVANSNGISATPPKDGNFDWRSQSGVEGPLLVPISFNKSTDSFYILKETKEMLKFVAE